MQVTEAAAADVGGGDRFDLSQNRAIGRDYLALLFRRYEKLAGCDRRVQLGHGQRGCLDQSRPTGRQVLDRVAAICGVCFTTAECATVRRRWRCGSRRTRRPKKRGRNSVAFAGNACPDLDAWGGWPLRRAAILLRTGAFVASSIRLPSWPRSTCRCRNISLTSINLQRKRPKTCLWHDLTWLWLALQSIAGTYLITKPDRRRWRRSARRS